MCLINRQVSCLVCWCCMVNQSNQQLVTSPHIHKRLLLLAPAMEKCRINHSPNKSEEDAEEGIMYVFYPCFYVVSLPLLNVAMDKYLQMYVIYISLCLNVLSLTKLLQIWVSSVCSEGESSSEWSWHLCRLLYTKDWICKGKRNISSISIHSYFVLCRQHWFTLTARFPAANDTQNMLNLLSTNLR